MGFLSKFEGRMEDTVEGAAEVISNSSLSPVQIAKKAEKQMRREKIVGAGKQYAPTLYTVLVSDVDDAKLFGYYPTLAGETETYLSAKAAELGFVMDGQPLVRFIPDPDLKKGKFDVVAEMVASPIVARLRNEEMARYGLATESPRQNMSPAAVARARAGVGVGAPVGAHAPGAGANVGANIPNQAAPYTASPVRAVGGAAGIHANPAVPNARTPAAAPNPASALSPQDLPNIGYQNDAGAYIDPSTSTALDPLNGALQESPVDAYLYDEEHDIAYVLTGLPQRIGRESSNDIVVHDINASRSHALIQMDRNGSWTITDTDSMNGVFINGRQITSAPLRDADMIRIGTTELEFQLLS